MGVNLPAVDLGPGATATALAAGDSHTCALLEGGRVKCWGENDHATLGLGDVSARGDGPNEMGANLPTVDLGPEATATAISAGSAHTCALLEGGAVKCWGYNTYGELGLGDVWARGDGPNEMGVGLSAVDLGPGELATKVVSNGAHTCARLAGARVKCWGRNNFGQLGLGDLLNHGDQPGEMGADLPFVLLMSDMW